MWMMVPNCTHEATAPLLSVLSYNFLSRHTHARLVEVTP